MPRASDVADRSLLHVWTTGHWQRRAVLDRSRPVDVGQRRMAYVEQGWQRFDKAADPYTPGQIAIERERYRRRRRTFPSF
jgi:hypothetical protein